MASGTAKKNSLPPRAQRSSAREKVTASGRLREVKTLQQKPLAELPRSTIRNMVESLGRLADEGRLRILLLLEEAPLNVAALGEALGHDRHSLSHHLRILRVSGLILATRAGRRVDYSLTPRGRLGVKAARLLIV